MSRDSANKWVVEQLEKMDLNGRDDFRTDLILQEIPFWYQAVTEGKDIPADEVKFLSKRRGFNKEEQKKFQALAAFFNTNKQAIHQLLQAV